MATFRVGQRVRIIGCKRGRGRHLGCEAVIDSGLVEMEDGRFGHEVTIIDPPAGLSATHTLGGLRRAFEPCYLIPIQPERNQTIPWSECLWQPNRTEETA